jgi:hypothetical protein
VHDKKSYPKAKSTVVCFYCKNAWPTKEALIEAHPADAIMRKQSETHLYAYWSEDSLDKLAEGEKPKMTRIVGLLSDEE